MDKEKRENVVATENNNAEQDHFRYYIAVHFKGAKKAYFFGLDDDTIKHGDFVVVETIRGMELGEAISDVRDRKTLKMATPLKPIIRKATAKDREDFKKNESLAEEALGVCQECVDKLKLDMNLISAEYTLDRNKIIFIYVSDDRVDFRELLKELASRLKCRIELRQIGARDKAKIVGGFGCCGMETCCSRFLDNFDIVSINMAKNQLLALNIQKLSGQCGKLMCCLKYEDCEYKEMRAGLPKMNAQITYKGKTYRVTSMNVITKEAKLENKEEALFLSFEEAFKEYKPQEKKNETSEKLR